ncbi:sigma-54 interaction domain-containing protein [Clostridium polynesiense]|uniref:sigma-54 interaction domain-containing protein n=1 Tax=Clostridium polynesiense TaxID=1325933 RepID=UPI00058DA7D0|nr:sigma-54-dependent Fis family transcriptional regulator [Clostridium polynesiense]
MGECEKILETLIASISEGIHIVDKEGKTIYYNTVMEKIEGVKKNHVMGKKINEISNLDERSSTLMNSLKFKQKFTDIIQKYSYFYSKEVTSINTTVPVILDSEVVAAIEIAKDMTQLKELSDKINTLESVKNTKEKGYGFEDILTANKDMEDLIIKAKKAAETNATVLITGETGSGKELFAQSIHYDGMRAKRPFIAINCAAIPSTLLEGTLFGTVKGSFTGAENKEGLFSQANGGTIFLDEINSMEMNLQSKLLRVLQEGAVRAVGAEKEMNVDIRVIAALNEVPEKLIREGKLRKDLYYRLSVVRINVLPLRERKEDIPILINHFIAHYNKSFGREIKGIESSSLKKLLEYSFPGNIRELRNIIESACIMSEDKKKLVLDPLDFSALTVEAKDNTDYSGDISLEKYIDNIERKAIENMLMKNEFNVSKTARDLKISRQNLQYKLKKHGIKVL